MSELGKAAVWHIIYNQYLKDDGKRCLCTVVADYEPVNLYDDAAACVGCHTVPCGTTNAVYMCLPVDDAYMAPFEFCKMQFPLKVCLCPIAFLVLQQLSSILPGSAYRMQWWLTKTVLSSMTGSCWHQPSTACKNDSEMGNAPCALLHSSSCFSGLCQISANCKQTTIQLAKMALGLQPGKHRGDAHPNSCKSHVAHAQEAKWMCARTVPQLAEWPPGT